jgi:transcriptional regulator with XRE-family HTH domain
MSDTAVVPEWSLADRLIKARRWAGLEQEDLAADFGMTRQAISKWERGTSIPRLVVIKQWAARTNVSLDWLLGEPVPTSGPPPAVVAVEPEPTPLGSAKRSKRGKRAAPSTKCYLARAAA